MVSSMSAHSLGSALPIANAEKYLKMDSQGCGLGGCHVERVKCLDVVVYSEVVI